MRVSLSWLKDYVDLPADRKDLERLLARLELSGLAIDTIDRPWSGASGIVAGMIRSVTPHPGSDGLRVATVDAGRERPLTLVSGAANFRPGDVVPVVPAGGALPGGRAIGDAEFGGVFSEGMMCSEAELLLAIGPEAEAGIMILPRDLPPGQDLTRLLCLDDEVLDLDLTPNYAAYCQSMLGVAREVAALTGGELREPLQSLPGVLDHVPDKALLGPLSAVERRDLATGLAGALASVVIEAPDLCDRYSGAVFVNLAVRPSPWWMQRRLIAAGVRPVNNVVDVTNYVMLEVGQPLHAFDLDLVADRRIIVREAGEGERIVTLDGAERSLTRGDLVIADPEKAIALAGVMGGGNTEINPQTQRVFLESAHFSPRAVRTTSRRLGLRTEASSRFEKGMDPSVTVLAIERVGALLGGIRAAQLVDGVIDVVAKASPLRRIAVPVEYARTLVGVRLKAAEMIGLLERIGIPAEVETGRADSLLVTVPARRPDIDGKADICEEIARSYGYDRIPAELPRAEMPAASLSPGRRAILDAGAVLRGFGLSELLTFSYHPVAELDRLGLPGDHPWREAIPVVNPMSEEQALLRRSLIPNFLRVLSYNAGQGVLDLHGYEIGRVFVPASLPLDALPGEPLRLGLVMSGMLPGAESWREHGRPVDFHTVKGVVEGLAATMLPANLSFERGTMPFTHPGRTAFVEAAGRRLGWIGELDSRTMEAYGLKGTVYLAELDYDALYALSGKGPGFSGLPRYPSVQRDLAFVVPQSVPAEEVRRLVAGAGGALLSDIRLFDVYQGRQVPPGCRSLAYALSFRSPDRTLTDAEVDGICAGIVEAVKSAGGVLRT